MPDVALQYKSTRLARSLASGLNSRLSPVARLSRQTTHLGKTDFSHSFLTLPYYIQTLIPTKCRKLPERILREKPQRKHKIDSSKIFTQRLFKFLYSLPLHCEILERHITKTFTHHTHIYEKAVWCFGMQLRRDQFHIGRCYGQVAESGKLKKKQVRRNLVGVGSQKAQVHWVNQAWRVFCYSCIPITFFSGLFTTWRMVERFYAKGFCFLFDNTSCVVLVFASLFP